LCKNIGGIVDKKMVVKKLFEKGVLVTPETLEGLDEKSADELAGSGQAVVGGFPEKARARVFLPEEKEKVSVKDFGRFYMEKYDGIRGMLSERHAPVSISNSAKSFDEVFVIVMVREHTPSGFVGEDMTGSVEVVSEKRLQLGDVVGVRGHVREGRVVESETVYPDVPLPKGVRRANFSVVLTSKRVEDGLQVVFGDGEQQDGVVYVSKSPARVELNGIKILVFEGEGEPKEWLKRRHLPGGVRGPRDFFLIKDVPDVLWNVSSGNRAESYKGVTIIQTDRKSWAKVNLFTRRVEFGGGLGAPQMGTPK